jgi:hypothetical protein
VASLLGRRGSIGPLAALEVASPVFVPSDALDTLSVGGRFAPPSTHLEEAAVSETIPAARAAEAEDSPLSHWTIHTVESWARAIVDDMVQELNLASEATSGVTGVEFQATYACFRDDDGSFRARIQILGRGSYNVHRVTIG